MGVLDKIFSGATSGLLEGAGEFMKDARQAITGEPDIDKQMKAYKELGQMQFDWGIQEARSKSIFVAGWRPWVGWVCGTAVAYHFLIQPIFAWFSGIWHFTPPPKIDMVELWDLLKAMLGMGILRSFDKYKGKG